jgi:hypothetical protein
MKDNAVRREGGRWVGLLRGPRPPPKQLLCLVFFLGGCATTAPPAIAPVGTLARARQDYTASLDSCEQVRSSRLSTLGPPIFQPIQGDERFNECLSRAQADYVAELNEAN